jgi:hypothetical protein
LARVQTAWGPTTGAFGKAPIFPVAWALIVLELADDRAGAVNSFLDVENLFPRFNLPFLLPPA